MGGSREDLSPIVVGPSNPLVDEAKAHGKRVDLNVRAELSQPSEKNGPKCLNGNLLKIGNLSSLGPFKRGQDVSLDE